MYSYGFTDGKFELPTPEVYMSYLSQLLVNMKCKIQSEINNGEDDILKSFHYRTGDGDRTCIIDGTISDQ